MNGVQLVIHISKTSVHIAEVFRSHLEVVRFMHFDLLENSALGYKEKLKSCFAEFSPKDEYEEYSLAWETNKQTIIPLKLFNESTPKDLFSFMFGTVDEGNEVDFNRLMELNMVSVFDIPLWVKSFFIMNFPKITIKHEYVMLLRALFQQSTFKKKVVIGFCDEYINICLIAENKLLFSNNFEFQSPEDILYHLVFVLEKKGWNNLEGEIEFYHNGDKTEETAKELKSIIEKHKPIRYPKEIKLENALKLQVLCV